MSHRLINAALSKHLQGMAYPVHFENQPTGTQPGQFNAPQGVYLAEAYLPAAVDPVGMETGSTDDYSGVYQVTVVAPRDGYKLAGRTAADDVAAHFARGTPLTESGVSVRVERVEEGPSLYAGDRWNIPVSIRFRSLSR